MISPIMRSWRPALLAVSLLVLPALRAGAQPNWTSLDGSLEGTPVDVILDPGASTGTHTAFDLFVHGFWTEPFTGPDQREYVHVTVPGAAPALAGVGWPALPTVTLPVAVAPGIADVVIAGVTRTEETFFPGMLPAPLFQPGIEGTPPTFVRDEDAYAFPGPWPPFDGDDLQAVEPRVGVVRGETVRIPLMRAELQSGILLVWQHLRVELEHAGAPQVSPEITKDCARLAAATFPNWPAAGAWYPPNVHLYNADYLIVTPSAYVNALAPLVKQKSTRGFRVQMATTDAMNANRDTIRAAIEDWYRNTLPEHDHYVLLVGDINTLPLVPVTDPTGGSSSIQSDDPYASMYGADLDEEVYLGRIAPDSAADCSTQVARILAYEDRPVVDGPYGKALLVAWQDTTYTNNQEKVRTTAYPLYPPEFTLAYGSSPGVRNRTVRDTIDAGLGLVAYRGHGDMKDWWQWNTANENFAVDTVSLLHNAPMTPVVWSIACATGNVGGMLNDCLGERFLWLPGGHGAVSFYGATGDSWTDANHELNTRLFEAVYGKGLTIESHAIDYAEAQMAAHHGKWGQANAWMYLLLGDPQLKIRHAKPPTWHVHAPAEIAPCGDPPCTVDFTVNMDDDLTPMAGLLVSAWKPIFPGPKPAAAKPAAGLQVTSSEVFANHYTGDDGHAQLEVSPTSAGWVWFAVTDDEGNIVLDSIRVTGTGGVGPAAAGRLVLRAQPSVTAGGTYLGFGVALRTPANVRVFDVAGRCVRELAARPGAWGVHWDGTGASGARLPGGLYFARVTTPQGDSRTRVVVLH